MFYNHKGPWLYYGRHRNCAIKLLPPQTLSKNTLRNTSTHSKFWAIISVTVHWPEAFGSLRFKEVHHLIELWGGHVWQLLQGAGGLGGSRLGHVVKMEIHGTCVYVCIFACMCMCVLRVGMWHICVYKYVYMHVWVLPLLWCSCNPSPLLWCYCNPSPLLWCSCNPSLLLTTWIAKASECHNLNCPKC